MRIRRITDIEGGGAVGGPDPSAQDHEAWVRRTRRHNFWKLGPANAATIAFAVCFVLLLLTPAWRFAAVAAVFVAAGWTVLRVLDRRDQDDYLAAVAQLDAPESLEFRYQAAGRVSPEKARERTASWQDEARTWLAGAPPVEAGDPGYDILEPDAIATELGASAANVGRRTDLAFAWSPFPAEYARSILRTWPDRSLGSVHRTADGQVAVRWEPAAPPGGTGA